MRNVFKYSGLAELRCTRRGFVQGLAAGSAAISVTSWAGQNEPPVVVETEERAIELINTHNGEAASVIYRHGDKFDPEALAKLDHLMRDHRNGEVHLIDPKLFDQLFELARAAECEPRYEVISGYRSPETNARMATPGSGVSKKSLHMQGRAIDVRLRGCDSDDLRDLALKAARGGVGYYQRSNFVHIDTGAFRTWNG